MALPATSPAVSRRSPLVRLGTVAGGAVLVLVWAWLLSYFRLVPTYGEGWKDFWSAGWVLVHGGNPYDPKTLWQAQNHLFNEPGHLHPGDLTYFYPDYYFNPPLFAWIVARLAPTGGTSGFGSAYLVWCVLLTGCAVAAVGRLLNDLGWLRGGARVAAVIGLLLTTWWFYVLWSGEQSPILWLAVVMASSLLLRGRALEAGLWISLGWLKPHLVLPLLPVLWLFCAEGLDARRRAMARPWGDRLQLVLGFVMGTLIWAAATALVMGLAPLGWWIGWLLHYSSLLKQMQSDLPSLTGLALILLPPPLSTLIGGLLGIVLLVLGWTAWRRLSDARLPLPPRASSALPPYGPWGDQSGPDGDRTRRHFIAVQLTIVLWLLLFPYSHQNDDIFVWGAVLLLAGRDGNRLSHAGVVTLGVAGVLLLAPIWRILAIPLGLGWAPATGVAVLPLVVVFILLWHDFVPRRLAAH